MRIKGYHPLVIYLSAFVIVAVVFYAMGCVFSAKKSPPEHFGIGRPATSAEIKEWDIDVRPDGKGLPAGSGNITSGQLIYTQKCAACHIKEGPGGLLFTEKPKAKTKTIGTYWPYATTIFDYVRRAMPYNAPGTLSDQEVYHLTAYLLYANKIIPADAVINQTSLPKIVMPAKKHYVNDDRQGGKELR